MRYSKPAVSIQGQIDLLKNRGLTIADEQKAVLYLSNISYYRLRAYTHPFQDNTDPNHRFTCQITVEKILSLYAFDKQFRLLVLDAIEQIEISFRTQIIYQWAMVHGSHWHLESSLFRNSAQFEKHSKNLNREINRSTETFINHYKKKYTQPQKPPAWMTMEVSSFGLLSLMFRDLKMGREKKAVLKHYGLCKIDVLESWMHSFSNIRNICAHHGRLWNRRLTAHIKIPTNTKKQFITEKNVYPYKLYAALCCMKYILDIISPNHTLTTRLLELMESCPLAQEKEMGFPTDWQQEKFWQI